MATANELEAQVKAQRLENALRLREAVFTTAQRVMSIEFEGPNEALHDERLKAARAEWLAALVHYQARGAKDWFLLGGGE